MKKRIITLVLLLTTVLALSGGVLAQREQRALSEKLIRLHVVARSDADHDQWVKLQVRDAVLAAAEPMIAGQENPRDALAEGLPAIRDAAAEALRELGEEDAVQVSLGMERFPTREYDSFSLPAGLYESLRVTIGEGEGHNWWCVIFPSICLTASMEELEEAAEVAGLTEGELRLITGEEPGFVLKFKVLELLQKLMEAIFGEK